MKQPKAPRLVTVAIFTTITIVFWIFISVYNVLTQSPQESVDPKLLEPIDPTLDTNALSKLEGRIFYEEGEVTTPPVVIQEVSPTPIPEEETEEVEESEESATESAVTIENEGEI